MNKHDATVLSIFIFCIFAYNVIRMSIDYLETLNGMKNNYEQVVEESIPVWKTITNE